MVLNDSIFFITAIVDLFAVLLLLRLGKQGLAGIIVTNIILVSSFGAMLIPLFGLTTNAGNVFYATIFLAAQVMAEHFGRKPAMRSVWTGFGALLLFLLMAQYTIRLNSVPETDTLFHAMQTLYTAVPRVALASMTAYLISQNLNVWLFVTLRRKTGKKRLWLRSLASSTLGQLVDSILFFSIAFAGTISTGSLLQTMLAGFGVKMLVALLGVPVLYMSHAVWRVSNPNESPTKE